MALKRLTRADFALIKSGQNRRFHGRYFTLSATKFLNNDSTEPKFTCVVSKKVSIHAVDRNRIKRLARETIQTLLKESSNPVSLVFYAKKEALDASYSDIESDIRTLLNNT